MKISQSISENFTWQRWCSPVKSPYLDYNAAHCIWFCRTTAFRQDGGFGGRGSGLFGGSLLWPLVSGDQPAEQPGGAGVVCWPLWGAQEEEFLHWGEEAAGKDHAGVSGRSQEGDIHVAYDDRKEPNVSYGNVMYYSSVYFWISQSAGIWPLHGHQVCYCEALWRRRSREHDGLFLWAFPPIGPQRSHWHNHRHAPQRST